MLFLIMYNVPVDQSQLFQHPLYLWTFAPLGVIFPLLLLPLEVPYWLSNLLVDLVVEMWGLSVSYPKFLILSQESPLELRNTSEPWEDNLYIAPLWIFTLLYLPALYLIALSVSPVPPIFVFFVVFCTIDCMLQIPDVINDNILWGKGSLGDILVLENTVSITLSDFVSIFLCHFLAIFCFNLGLRSLLYDFTLLSPLCDGSYSSTSSTWISVGYQ